MGPCKGAFKLGYCRCYVEHFNRLDKQTIPCPYEHWVLAEEPEVGAGGVQTGRITTAWYQLARRG